MLIKKILGFSMASTTLAIGGPVAAYLTKPEASVNTSQEEGAQAVGATARESASSNDKYSYDSWGWDF